MIGKVLRFVFPIRGDRPGEVLRKAVSILAFAVLVYCTVRVGLYAEASLRNRQVNSALADSLYSSASASSGESSSGSSVIYPVGILDRFKSLYAANSQIRGWITVPDTNISLPVLQTDDNAYYLKKDFYKKYSYYGEPFLDYRDKIQPMSKNLIIYGHNMNDDQMFHELVNYKDAGFYAKAPVIQFDTIYGDYQWKVFAAFIADTDENRGDVFQYLYTNFDTDDSFLSFISDVRKRSLITTSVDVKASDTILTLSTCTYEFKDARLVVMARLLRGGESPSGETAVKNKSALMPEIWSEAYEK